jgi:hypothetical protein
MLSRDLGFVDRISADRLLAEADQLARMLSGLRKRVMSDAHLNGA